MWKEEDSMRTRLSLLAAAGLWICIGDSAFASQVICGNGHPELATGEPIYIGGISSKTGPADYSAGMAAAAAYFKCVNAHGGIDGRPIEYLAEDDQWNPEVALQKATYLVNDRKVLALVGSNTIVGCAAFAETLAKANVVDIGMGSDQACFNSSHIISLNAGPQRGMAALAEYAKLTYGVKKIAISGMNQPGVPWILAPVKAYAAANGLEVVELLYDTQSADPTSFALQIAQTGADAFIFALPKDLSVAILNAAEQQDLGDTMHFLSSTALYSPEIPGVIGSYWDDKLNVGLEFGPTFSSDPDTENWKAVMREYGSSGDALDSFSQAGMIAAQMVTQALQTLGPDKLDRASVSEALLHVKGYANGMLCSPFTVAAPDGNGHNDNDQTLTGIQSEGAWKIVRGCTAIPVVSK